MQSIENRGLEPLLTWLSQAAQTAMEGGDLTAALASAQKKADAYLACMAFATKRVQDQMTACLQEVDPTLNAP